MTADMDGLEKKLRDAVQHCLAYRQYRTLDEKKSEKQICKYGPKSAFFRMLGLPEDYPLVKERVTPDSMPVSYPLGLTDYTGMNDPTEGRLLVHKLEAPEDPVLLGERGNLREVYEEIRRFRLGGPATGPNLKGARERTTFISCFSEAKNSLDLWRLYADNGKGVCLVVRPDKLSKVHKERLYTVGYRHRDVCNAFDNILQPTLLMKTHFESSDKEIRDRAINAIVEAHNEIRYLFKFDSYSIEQEVRYLWTDSPAAPDVKAFSPEKGIIRLYRLAKDFFTPDSLDEVIVGPASDLRVEAVQIALCDRGLANVKVWKSTHPYR